MTLSVSKWMLGIWRFLTGLASGPLPALSCRPRGRRKGGEGTSRLLSAFLNPDASLMAAFMRSGVWCVSIS